MKEQLARTIATLGFYDCFGARLPAPGTCGSLVAVLSVCMIPPAHWVLSLFLLTLAATVLGVWSCRHTLAQFPENPDPSFIVIDEVAGQWAALLFAGGSLPWMVVSFGLFRLLDIWKPGPIGALDRMQPPSLLGKAWVIMADDLLAGIVTSIIIFILQQLLSLYIY